MIERRSGVPVHLYLGSHDGVIEGNFRPAGERIKSYLENSPPDRKVIYVAENATMFEEHPLLTRFSEIGVPPSLIFAFVDYLYENKRPPTPDEALAWRPQFLAGESIFTREKLEILDEIDSNYPGRLQIEMEGSPIEDILEDARTRPRERMSESYWKAIELTIEGDFAAALPAYKESTLILVSRLPKREERIANLIDKTTERNDVEAVVAYFGHGHSAIFHRLNNLGLNASRHFVEKRGKIFYYSPSDVMVRQLYFLPDHEITEDDWIRSMVMEATLRCFFDPSEPHDPTEEQKILRLMYAARAGFNQEGLRSLERRIKKIGFMEAVEEMVIGD